MYQKLANKLSASGNLAQIEADTGVTQQTMKNIIADPTAKRSRVVLIALEAYFKMKGKK